MDKVQNKGNVSVGERKAAALSTAGKARSS